MFRPPTFCLDLLTFVSVTFQWSISYIISPDAANLGLKAIYIWAGLLVPTTVLLYLYYPEVSLIVVIPLQLSLTSLDLWSNVC
jgi:hypothetical protein